MERIVSGAALALLFCLIAGLVYLRSPPSPASKAAEPGRHHFVGQRHASIDVAAEDSAAAP